MYNIKYPASLPTARYGQTKRQFVHDQMAGRVVDQHSSVDGYEELAVSATCGVTNACVHYAMTNRAVDTGCTHALSTTTLR